MGRSNAIGRYSRAKLNHLIEQQGGAGGDITAVTAGNGLSGGGTIAESELCRGP